MTAADRPLTGAEHFAKAAELAALIEQSQGYHGPSAAARVALAQVHATLALASATASAPRGPIDSGVFGIPKQWYYSDGLDAR